MNTKTILTQKLSNHFQMHPSRRKTFFGLIFGALTSNQVTHKSLSRHVISDNELAATRKVERFFQHQELPLSDYVETVISIFDLKEKLNLCIDRTNWSFGGKETNYLVVSCRLSKYISIPLFIDLNKKGNSSTAERIALLDQFFELLGKNKIGSFMGDREFIGEKWMCYLQENNVPFYIRVKANMLVPHGNDQKHIGDYFKHLRIGEVRRLEKEMYGFPCTFEGTRTKKGDLIIIMSNQVILSPGEILKKYKKRWSIEKLFKNLKSDGFNWEMTHMKDPKRLVKLLIILSLSCLCCSLVGLTVKIPWRSTVEYPLVCAFKAGLKRIQYYISNNIDCFIEKMLNLLDSSKSIFKKNPDSQLTLLDFQGIWNK